jgi:hypothetical protein
MDDGTEYERPRFTSTLCSRCGRGVGDAARDGPSADDARANDPGADDAASGGVTATVGRRE